ncbi:MAG: hypothetical protein ACI9TH_000318 [Kiritimatiellia bacterium]|jgi:hypothetical protein
MRRFGDNLRACLRWLILGWVVTLHAASEEAEVPVHSAHTDLTARGEAYFEVAVFVLTERPETIKEDGLEFRILKQDVETDEIKPKMKRSRATGFFLLHKDAYYFITARHVARSMTPGTRLGFINARGDSRSFIFAKLVGSAERFTWIHHPKTDLSAMKLHIPEKGPGELSDVAMRTEDLYLAVPPRTSRLVVSGFPGGLGTRGGKISPITAVVHLASDEIVLDADLDGIHVDTAYLVNPPAGKGFSGGPIFYELPDGSVKCTGILNGAWSDPTGGKFSISVPARHILDLLPE